MNAVLPLASVRDSASTEQDEYVVVIGGWTSLKDDSIWLQDFFQGDERFFPIFSNTVHFDAEVSGSGFEEHGIIIRKDFLASILRGDELLILNPGSVSPQRLTKADLT